MKLLTSDVSVSWLTCNFGGGFRSRVLEFFVCHLFQAVSLLIFGCDKALLYEFSFIKLPVQFPDVFKTVNYNSFFVFRESV
jgi:hypothetical protein